ncbi:MAG: hypothetical protein OJF49_002707 [Ktedonobacterales bacterium]|jgi:uncharacterized membrane protein|nr:MAG: hypothetical protein OJF49_002707 [Ktedonobacterales bacterium]
MTLGPVQFVMIGLDNDKQRGQVAAELRNVSDEGIIRVLDALAIRREPDGTVISLGASDLSEDERMAYGAVVGGLLGMSAGGEEGAELGAEMGAEAFADQNFGLSDTDIQDIARDIPAGKTVLMVLFEHHWAVALKDALMSAGGVVLAQGLVQPESLAAYSEVLADLTSEEPSTGPTVQH